MWMTEDIKNAIQLCLHYVGFSGGGHQCVRGRAQVHVQVLVCEWDLSSKFCDLKTINARGTIYKYVYLCYKKKKKTITESSSQKHSMTYFPDIAGSAARDSTFERPNFLDHPQLSLVSN